MNKCRQYLKLFIADFLKFDLFGKSAEISYYALTSLFPLIIFIIAIIPYLNINPQELMGYVNMALPTAVSAIFNDLITYFLTDTSSVALSIGLFFTIISASSVITSLFKNLSLIYEVPDKKNTLILKLQGILDMLVIILIVYLMLFVYVISISIIKEVLGPNLSFIIIIIKTIFIPILMFLITTYIYFKISKIKKIKYIIPGSLSFILIYFIFTKGYEFYLVNIASNSLKYGVLSYILVILLWMFTTSLFILMGGLVNKSLLKFNNVGTKD